MSNDVYWTLELEIQPGREEDFRILMNEMVGATRADEPGTLNCEWSVSVDGGTCHIYERYADPAAVMVHLETFGSRFAGRFLEILRPVRFLVFGAPDAAVREALAGFAPVYMRLVGGFTR